MKIKPPKGGFISRSPSLRTSDGAVWADALFRPFHGAHASTGTVVCPVDDDQALCRVPSRSESTERENAGAQEMPRGGRLFRRENCPLQRQCRVLLDYSGTG